MTMYFLKILLFLSLMVLFLLIVSLSIIPSFDLKEELDKIGFELNVGKSSIFSYLIPMKLKFFASLFLDLLLNR